MHGPKHQIYDMDLSYADVTERWSQKFQLLKDTFASAVAIVVWSGLRITGMVDPMDPWSKPPMYGWLVAISASCVSSSFHCSQAIAYHYFPLRTVHCMTWHLAQPRSALFLIWSGTTQTTRRVWNKVLTASPPTHPAELTHRYRGLIVLSRHGDAGRRGQQPIRLGSAGAWRSAEMQTPAKKGLAVYVMGSVASLALGHHPLPPMPQSSDAVALQDKDDGVRLTVPARTSQALPAHTLRSRRSDVCSVTVLSVAGYGHWPSPPPMDYIWWEKLKKHFGHQRAPPLPSRSHTPPQTAPYRAVHRPPHTQATPTLETPHPQCLHSLSALLLAQHWSSLALSPPAPSTWSRTQRPTPRPRDRCTRRAIHPRSTLRRRRRARPARTLPRPSPATPRARTTRSQEARTLVTSSRCTRWAQTAYNLGADGEQDGRD